jgi:hypothetical protein
MFCQYDLFRNIMIILHLQTSGNHLNDSFTQSVPSWMRIYLQQKVLQLNMFLILNGY